MSNTVTTTYNGKIKVAFNGSTYFVKFLDAHMAKWLPVKSVTVDRLNNTLIVTGVYGLNCGIKQRIVNIKNQDVSTNLIRVNLDSFKENNRVKLYESSVKTNVSVAKVIRNKANKIGLRPTFSMLDALKSIPEDIKETLPEHIKRYL